MRRFLLPLLVFVAGLAAGAWFSVGRRAADFSAGVEHRLVEKAVATPGARAFSNDEEMLTAIMSAAVEDEPLLRGHRLHGLLGRLGSRELGLIFDSAVKIENQNRRSELLEPLLARWAAVDPAAADEAARPYRDRFLADRLDRDNLDSSVSSAWAEAMPDAALAAVMTAPLTLHSQRMAESAMETLAEGDPARQLAVLARQPATPLRAQMCAQAITVLMKTDVAAAEAALDLVTEPRVRANVQAMILGKLTERDTAAGLARLAALAPDLAPGVAGVHLVAAILRPAAAKDPSAALAAIDALPEKLRTPALASVLVGWAEVHLMEALEWVAANGVDVSDVRAPIFDRNGEGSGANSLFDTALEHDREKTLAWVRAQPASPQRDALLAGGMWSGPTAQRLEMFAELTPEGRTRAAGNIVTGLYGEDRDRAVAWVKDLSPGPARAIAVEQLAYREAGSAPERLDALAAAWPAGPDRDAAMRGVASQVSQNDPAHALDYARRVSDPVTRESVLSNVARNWLDRDAASARTWLAGTTDLSAESKRVLLRQFDER